MSRAVSEFIRSFSDAALRFDCDKVIDHDYAEFYATIFPSIRSRSPRLLEIGAGGYTDPMSGGASARLWSEVLPNWSIVIVDIAAKGFAWPERTTFCQADQGDPKALDDIGRRLGPFDVIIDDGSHLNEHVRTSLWALFPYLKESGHYVIEDTQTSYIPEYGGDVSRESSTTANLARDLFDYANFVELPDTSSVPPIFKNNIHEVRFRHNILSVLKKTVDRHSNLSSTGLRRMEEVGRMRLDPSLHASGYFLRTARYMARLDQISAAIETLHQGQQQWPDDREIKAALTWLRQLQSERREQRI